ncbi:hypothetical protein KIN20_004735 [Parelaphostrongylus tenuis]|uniref:Uncharacterized protein n=1 Tax=Parelaphostrongylus tenuis TaxID=148309 RepID=A0AAD5QI70_PARTN|nr:hypothetical protein KIN20_004735 [Parelaphostrongylus tenuis]
MADIIANVLGITLAIDLPKVVLENDEQPLNPHQKLKQLRLICLRSYSSWYPQNYSR